MGNAGGIFAPSGETEQKPAPASGLTPSHLRTGRRYRPQRLAERYDAIVIGSGMGGLTTAACMARAGKKVLVLEQHYTAGGFTHSYARNGYEWDVGVHYIGDVGSRKSLNRRLFDFITDGQLQWAPMDDNYDRFFFAEQRFDAVAGKQAYVAALKQRFPAEHAAIDAYMERLARASKAFRLMCAQKLFNGAGGRVFDAARRALQPAYLNRTTDAVLSELTDNELLKAVLTGQWGDSGACPTQSSFIIHSLIANHYMRGAYYPVGGAARIAQTIIPVIQGAGGEVFTYADVAEILLRGKRVRGVKMRDGTEIISPLVISNAGVYNTFEHLLPAKVSRRHGYDKCLSRVQPSIAHMGLYIGVKQSAVQLNLPKTNLWIYPSTHHEDNLAAFAADHGEAFPAVYISFPSAKDPSWEARYPGTATIEVVAPAFYDTFESWRDQPWGQRGADYDALKLQFTERLLDALYQHLPQLRGQIDYCELSTPLSTDFFCRYSRGEMYGLSHDPQRFEQSWLRPKTRIRGLYLTGQDIVSCGVSGAMFSGLLTSLSALGPSRVKLLRALASGKSSNLSEAESVKRTG